MNAGAELTITPLPVTAEAAAAFPGLLVPTVRAAVGNREAVAAAAEEGWQALYQRWRDADEAELLESGNVGGYLDLGRALGLAPDRHPPSIVALVNRGLRGRPPGSWPRINPVVDIVNVVAVRTLTSLGVFDAGKLEGQVRVALAQGDEGFVALGAKKPIRLGKGELVLRDDSRVLSLFARRDGVHQAVTPDTIDTLVLGCVVPGVDGASVADALVEVHHLLTPLDPGPTSRQR